jgi:CBS domain-containing protein
VYDYAPGKADWLAAGLTTVRAPNGERRVLEVVDRHPPECTAGVALGEAIEKARAAGRTSVVVVSDDGVVLGRIRAEDVADAGDVPVAALMEAGPATVRADQPLEQLRESMSEHDTNEMIVTTPDGRLLGVFHRHEGA